MSKIKGLQWNKLDQQANRIKLVSDVEALMKGNGFSIEDNYGFQEGNWNLTDILTADDKFKVPALQQLYGEDVKGKRTHSLSTNMKFRLKVHSRQICWQDKSGNELRDLDWTEKPKEGDVIRWKNIPRPSERATARNTREIKNWNIREEDSYKYEYFRVDKDGCIEAGIDFAHLMLKKHGSRLVYPQFLGRGKGRHLANWIFEEVPSDFAEKVEPPKKVGRPKKEVKTDE